MAITDWPEGERPREKLLQKGAASLSDAELLAIFLRTGLPGKSAVDLARELHGRFGGLNALFAAGEKEFCQTKGMGTAKYAQLQAVRDFLRLRLQGLPHEIFMALFLDAQNRVIVSEELFRGTLTQTSVYPREGVKRALHHNAAAVILAHNHPSGVSEPSNADQVLTQALKNALVLVDVRVLDHFIVAGSGFLSFAERGLL